MMLARLLTSVPPYRLRPLRTDDDGNIGEAPDEPEFEAAKIGRGLSAQVGAIVVVHEVDGRKVFEG